jgi:hypothetical protein
MKTLSHSQTRTMRICERRWFLSYGLGAKITSKDPFLKQIAFLKKLKPSFMWRGDLVHNTIADVLRAAEACRVMGLDNAISLLEKTAYEQWEDSERRARTSNPRSSLPQEGPILFEHYYPNLNNGCNVEDIIKPAKAQFVALYNWIESNGLFEAIASTNRVWIDPSVFFPNSPGFKISDVRFITKVDLALQFNNRFSIYDWKTSAPPRGDFKSTAEHGQVSFYALWPHLEMNLPIENVQVTVVYVGGGKPKAHEARLSPHDVERLIADAELNVDAMRGFLEADSGFILEDFDWATSGKSCYWCPFQELCQKELA